MSKEAIMIHTIKLTSKRQATFPVQLCRELGIQPGDELVLERKELEEGPVWILTSQQQHSQTWFGRLSKYASGKSHDMEDIRTSIGSGLGRKT
jgi:bifunctional DNA-binding transcriptional regulator/antitoxin component of YhaV-PrlF toxin-antitoxin module